MNRNAYWRQWKIENPDKVRVNNARRIRIRAGGIQFYLGTAPTLDDTKKLKLEVSQNAP